MFRKMGRKKKKEIKSERDTLKWNSEINRHFESVESESRSDRDTLEGTLVRY